MSCCILLLSQKRTMSQTKTINRRPNSGKWRESSLRMSAKYGIAFSADMKSYPGKLWTVTAQNSNKPGLHTSNIAGAVDREDLHQIPILTLNIYFSLNRFHRSLRQRAAETSLTCDAGSTFWHFQDRSRNHRIMGEQKPHQGLSAQ